MFSHPSSSSKGSYSSSLLLLGVEKVPRSRGRCWSSSGFADNMIISDCTSTEVTDS
tara:strand:- start:169 stop:336 length:168 start_codon:yes stop_codon:yes gene_type:complete